MKRLSKREITKRAHVNVTSATHATYFPFLEYCERIAYSAGVYGWTGNLFRGLTSGVLYAVTDYGNENAPTYYDLMQQLGNREKYVMKTLERIEETEHDGCKKSVLVFYSRDGEPSFKLATFDYGHTWNICG